MKNCLTKFIGLEVMFGVSDPWDFYTSHGDQEYSATVKAASSELLLLELALPIQYKGVVCKHLVATARHADKSLADITSTHGVPVNLIPAIIREEADANADNLFNAAKAWRGWDLIGGLKAKKCSN